MGDCWNKKHRQVLYKGVDITDKIGLCICDECTKSIRSEIDALLKAKELSATDSQHSQLAIALIERLDRYERDHTKHEWPLFLNDLVAEWRIATSKRG